MLRFHVSLKLSPEEHSKHKLVSILVGEKWTQMWHCAVCFNPFVTPSSKYSLSFWKQKMPKERPFLFVCSIRLETGFRCGGTWPFSLNPLRISSQGNLPALQVHINDHKSLLLQCSCRIYINFRSLFVLINEMLYLVKERCRRVKASECR